MQPPLSTERPGGATLAYHRNPGKGPGVVFLGGFRSDMEGSKAVYLDHWCREQGRAFLRFDYSGHGQSSGAFEEGTIGQWADDAIFALDQLTEGPQVLVGSSMGGWIMLLAALARPERVAGLVGLAAAPDFTEDLMWDIFTDEMKARLEKDGVVEEPNDYDPTEPYVITKALIEDGRKHLLLRQPLDINVPVRLIQGMQDKDVPWKTALRLEEALTSADVEVQLIKAAGHRLSEPADLARLGHTVGALLDQLETPCATSTT